MEDKFLPKDISLPHATAGIFVGYDHKSQSYLFYMPATQRLLPRRDAVLFGDRPGVMLPGVGTTTLIGRPAVAAPDGEGFAWLEPQRPVAATTHPGSRFGL